MNDFAYVFTTMNFQYRVLLLLPLVFWFLWAVRQRATPAVEVASASSYLKITRSLRQRLRPLVLGILAISAVTCLSISAARPQRVHVLPEVKKSRNLILAIDVSPSMGAEDFRGLMGRLSRLTAVKGVVSEFVGERRGDRLGLVVFGGAAFLQSPLTFDSNLVKTLVDSLQVGMAGEGTAVGDGLGVALKRMQEVASESSSIILLTDGVSNAGQVNPLKAAKVARDLGIKIHTIGIGSREPITVRGPGGIFSSMVQQRIEYDEETLQEISRLTGGVYFNASDVEGLEKVYEEIDQLESSAADSEDHTVAEELFVPYAWCGLAAYFAYVLLSLTIFQRIPE